MAERQTAITPAREEHRFSSSRPWAWAGTPFSVFHRMADEMGRMFDDFGFGHRWAPAIDVVQKNHELTIRADLPGLKRGEVWVEITDDAVRIQGERKREVEEDHEGFYRSERSYGTFLRVVPLPEGAMTDQAKAYFRDGVLEVVMPAPPSSKGRRLEISEAPRK